MAEGEQSGLKKRIVEEMTIDHTNALENNFDLAKRFIGIRKDGRVDILVKGWPIVKEQILLYLIGKRYAKEGGLAATEEVANEELLDELGLPEGSLRPRLKELREEGKVKTVRKGRYAHHSIPLNRVEKSLKSLAEKLKNRAPGGEDDSK